MLIIRLYSLNFCTICCFAKKKKKKRILFLPGLLIRVLLVELSWESTSVFSKILIM